MTQEQINEGNKLIVGFCGGNINNVDFYGDFSGCQYHSSWDWLMPVVEKIESTKVCNKGGFAVIINGTGCHINSMTYIRQTKIEAVWSAVVDYVNKYKEQS